MHFKLLLVGCIVASIAVAQISAQCACGAEGEDYCSCSLTRVPRPQQLLPRFQSRPAPAQQRTCTCSSPSSVNRQAFSPVGDRCSCGNSAVVPAIRPPCACQNKNPASVISSPVAAESGDCGRTIAADFESNVYTPNQIVKEDFSSLIPVDPVSMSLAYKSAHRATVTVPEEKLAFGFKKTPTNAESINPVPNIPEEKLSTFDARVVELKDIPCRRKQKKEEEIEEEEEEENEDDSKPNCGLGYLNYNQMGYVVQKQVDPSFAVHQFVEAEVNERPCSEDPIQEIGSCGYRPGKILQHADNEEIQGYVYSK